MAGSHNNNNRHTFNTYKNGISVRAETAMTKHDMVALCHALEQRFGEGNKFKPDAIGGGFINWIEWPGMTDSSSGYKCMRLSSNDSWPWVEADAMTKWADNKEDVIVKMGKTYHTFLKALDAAPAWTEDELNVVEKCLVEFGFVNVSRRCKNNNFKHANKWTY
jgi:hypothetical protein